MIAPFDIFRVEGAQSVMWVGTADDLKVAKERIDGLLKSAPSEYVILSHKTGNKLRVKPRARTDGRQPRVFQIGYDPRVISQRTEALSKLGCDVVSAMGNEEAARILSSGSQHFDLCIIGHGSDLQDREEMAAFLKRTWPDTEILALNPAGADYLPGADQNVTVEHPEEWLLLAQTLLGL